MKVFVLVLVLVFVGFCSAALGDDWDSFSDGENLNTDDTDFDEEVVDVVGVSDEEVSLDSGDANYTNDFYLALGAAAVGVLLVLLFVYLFFRRPKDKWVKPNRENRK